MLIILKALALSLKYLPLILGILAYFVLRMALLSTCLFVMLRAQDLNHTVWKVLGCAAAASVFDMIPFVGHCAAVGVLLFCVLKMTQAEFIDVRFTVAISYAVMFLIQMLILSVMPTDFSANARTLSKAVAQQTQPSEYGDETATTPAVVETNIAPVKLVYSNLKSSNTLVTKPAANSPPVNYADPELVALFRLKGVTRSPKFSMVIIATASKTYSMELGETRKMETPKGLIAVKVKDITEDGALLNAGGIEVPLRLEGREQL